MGKLELSDFALFWDTYSRSDIEQPWNGGSQGGLVKNQCDVQDATLSNSNNGSTFAYLVAGLGIGAAICILLAPKSGAERINQGQEKISEVVEAGREAIGKS